MIGDPDRCHPVTVTVDAMGAFNEVEAIRKALAELVMLRNAPRDGPRREAWNAAWSHARHLLNREAP